MTRWRSARILVALVLIGATHFVAGCARPPSHEDLNRVLDSYPLPASFRQVSAKEYTFDDGEWGGEVDAVSRYFEAGEIGADPEAIRDALARRGVKIRDRAADVELGRISTEYEGVNVVVFAGDEPIEVRAYQLV